MPPDGGPPTLGSAPQAGAPFPAQPGALSTCPTICLRAGRSLCRHSCPDPSFMRFFSVTGPNGWGGANLLPYASEQTLRLDPARDRGQRHSRSSHSPGTLAYFGHRVLKPLHQRPEQLYGAFMLAIQITGSRFASAPPAGSQWHSTPHPSGQAASCDERQAPGRPAADASPTAAPARPCRCPVPAFPDRASP